MLQKTRGIVLNYLKYGESSIIVRIYTEALGLQSYIVNGVRSAKSKNKIALFQPLTLLDLVVYHREQAQLQRIKELKCEEPFSSIPFEFRKSGIAMFMTEVLVKTVKQEEENEPLFKFLHHSIMLLDHLKHNYTNFHLQFLLKLSVYLGFGPGTAEELYEQAHPGGNTPDFGRQEKQLIETLLEEGFENDIKMTGEQRRTILRNILIFYRLHVDHFGELRSLTVLQEVMG